ncbi:MAG TPA: DUF2064 domain-containing protein, partial [Pricia sp.]|nr:DUF2064 domain-containing protein [Pricia sp.]
NAFQDLFDRGYSKVISIGNDSPDLNVETLRKAIAAIQHKDMVVGPATDGGVYLLGLTRSLFNAGEFLALPWLQDSLCDALTQRSYWQQGGICFLDTLSDIDDTTSLLQFVQGSSDVFLADFILWHLSRSGSVCIDRPDIPFSGIRPSSLTLRGPPPSFQKKAA